MLSPGVVLSPGTLHVRSAEWPRDLLTVQRLLVEYFHSLQENTAVPAEIRAKDRRAELDALTTRYCDTSSAMLLAATSERVCGCAAVQMLHARKGAAELKRLYVPPEARGQGTGRALVQACATWARQRSAHELLLDTLPEAMPGAVQLYRSLGFQPTDRYNSNQGTGFAFFRLDLG